MQIKKGNKVFEKCPACGGGLYVTQLSCGDCDTVVQGNFSLSAFDRLPADSLHFLELFVRNRGNLKEMERELKQPYQTLRNRLNAIVGEMGFEVGADEEERKDLAMRRREVLERLDRGEVNAAEAAQELERLK
jgi:hypothetical protein